MLNFKNIIKRNPKYGILNFFFFRLVQIILKIMSLFKYEQKNFIQWFTLNLLCFFIIICFRKKYISKVKLRFLRANTMLLIMILIICLVDLNCSIAKASFRPTPRYMNYITNSFNTQPQQSVLLMQSTMTLYSSNMREREVRPLNDTPMELCDENVDIVMEEVRYELGTLFGYDAGNTATPSTVHY